MMRRLFFHHPIGIDQRYRRGFAVGRGVDGPFQVRVAGNGTVGQFVVAAVFNAG